MSVARSGPDRFFFLHIPKTGGTSFRHMLYDVFPDADLLPNAAELRSNGGRYLDLPQLKSLPPERTARSRLLHGHLPYEARDLLQPKPAILVFLRDPADRTLSSVRQHLVRGRMQHPGAPRSTILGLIENRELRARLGNLQTQMLGGLDPADGRAPGEEHLERAKTRLRRCAFIGITERFDQSILLCERTFGWRFPHRLRLNVTAEKDAAEADIQDEQSNDLIRARRLLAELDHLDIELYRFAANEFQDRLERGKR